MSREPAVFVAPERGNQFTSLDGGNDGHITGKGLIPPNVIVMIVTVNQRGYRPGKQRRDRIPEVCCRDWRNKSIKNENLVTQVNDARVALGCTAFPVDCGKDSICQLVKLEMGRSESTHSSPSFR
jgi:hypothetical protein